MQERKDFRLAIRSWGWGSNLHPYFLSLSECKRYRPPLPPIVSSVSKARAASTRRMGRRKGRDSVDTRLTGVKIRVFYPGTEYRGSNTCTFLTYARGCEPRSLVRRVRHETANDSFRASRGRLLVFI